MPCFEVGAHEIERLYKVVADRGRGDAHALRYFFVTEVLEPAEFERLGLLAGQPPDGLMHFFIELFYDSGLLGRLVVLCGRSIQQALYRTKFVLSTQQGFDAVAAYHENKSGNILDLR